MFYRVREGSTVATSPDLVRPIDAPSRGPEYRSTDFLPGRIGCKGRAILRSRTECPRLGTGFGVTRRWIEYICGFVDVTGDKGASPYQSRPRKRGNAPRRPPKKIQPPVSAGYEGLLFPPEQSEKIFGVILAQVSGYFK
jgi:hypothetical protein